MDMDNQSLSLTEIMEKVERATVDYKICLNRIWEIARSFPQREKILPLLIPPVERIKQAIELEGNDGHHQHSECTFDFCEFSRRDFTSVEQRHELSSCRLKPCNLLKGRFRRSILEQAARNGTATAWNLGGKSMIRPPQRFMAVSHVWSDGTGTGSWRKGEVNECLYEFVERTARNFECEGIWWDTICIPSEKGARSKAINVIQTNHEDARITLVHDCFLRRWKWVDAETACFAILISPWFSRGWTALELAKSRHVKVVFEGMVIKDLDKDILAEENDPSASLLHKTATEAIKRLRRDEIRDINDLLTVLGSRHTSWPRDVAVIAGLLVGIEVPLDASQQNLYQRILKKLTNISYGHVFHNSATMSKGFCWCPTSLLDMPHASSKNELQIKENGYVVGVWKVFSPNSFSEKNYVWNNIHPLIRVRLNVAILHDNKDQHVLLAEQEDETDLVSRVLLVKVLQKEEFPLQLLCQFVGAVHFYSPQRPSIDARCWTEVEVIIGHSDEFQPARNAWECMNEMSTAMSKHNSEQDNTGTRITQSLEPKVDGPIIETTSQEVQLLLASASGNEKEVKKLLQEGAHPDFRDKNTWTSLHFACWRGYNLVVMHLIEGGADQNIQDRLGQYPLHLAAERGEFSIVKRLYKETDLNFQCSHDRQTPLHRAAWGRSKKIIELLLERSNPTILDKNGKTALDLAYEQGDTSITELLRRHCERVLRSPVGNGTVFSFVRNRKNPLLCAAEQGDTETVLRLFAEGTDLGAKSGNGQTALSWAARNGYTKMVQLLLEKGADLDPKDHYGMTPLLWASHNGHLQIAEVLLKLGADLGSKDFFQQRTALWWATNYGHEKVMLLLLEKGHKFAQINSYNESALLWAAGRGQEEVLRLLTERNDVSVDWKDSNGRTPLWIAAERGHEWVVQILLERDDIVVNSKGPGGRTPLWVAVEYGYEGVVQLLLARDDIMANLENSAGQTPLWAAVEHGHENVVRKLLEREDVATRWKASITPSILGKAVNRNEEGILGLLLERADTIADSKDVTGQRLLWSAVDRGQEGIVRLFLARKNVKADWKASNGMTPLSIAALRGYEGIVRLLLAHDDTLADSKDSMGQTPLWYAENSGHEGVARLLKSHQKSLYQYIAAPEGDRERFSDAGD